MADIFVSYANSDRDWVRDLANSLGSQGWTIWWDREIPVGRNFRQVIAEALGAARCATVIWSRDSVSSDWVLEEADEAKKRNILLPVMKEQVEVPLGFRAIQAADLTDWRGQPDHAGLRALLRSMQGYVGVPRELSFDEAVRLIQRFCVHRRVRIGEIVTGEVSYFGTKSFKAAAKDGLGTVFCHASGNHVGEVYYVRKGIAIYYHRHIGGPTSPLGLPISNEEVVDGTGFPTSFFENGYIDWSPKSGEARAMLMSADGEQQLGRPVVT